jgi:hypothetical protein
LRLLGKGPSLTDKIILVEAAFLSDFYQKEEEVEVYLASSDYCFSPMGPTYESRLDTDEIF